MCSLGSYYLISVRLAVFNCYYKKRMAKLVNPVHYDLCGYERSNSTLHLTSFVTQSYFEKSLILLL